MNSSAFPSPLMGRIPQIMMFPTSFQRVLRAVIFLREEKHTSLATARWRGGSGVEGVSGTLRKQLEEGHTEEGSAKWQIAQGQSNQEIDLTLLSRPGVFL